MEPKAGIMIEGILKWNEYLYQHLQFLEHSDEKGCKPMFFVIVVKTKMLTDLTQQVTHHPRAIKDLQFVTDKLWQVPQAASLTPRGWQVPGKESKLQAQACFAILGILGGYENEADSEDQPDSGVFGENLSGCE